MSKQKLSKDLQSRHLITMSLGGVIGTGIFMSTGYSIQFAGPIGTIIAYIIGSLLVCMVMACLGELSVHDPSTGAFHTYASKYISPAMGFVVAWMYWLTWTIALGSEFIALSTIAKQYITFIPVWGYSLIFAIIILLLNIVNMNLFAKSELYMSLIKVIALALFLIISVLIIFKILPFHHQNFTPFFGQLSKNGIFPNGISPVISIILSANFTFSGTEMIAVGAGESKNPKKSVPKAIRKTLITLIVLFIGTIIALGSILPQSSSSLSQSPFVTILQSINIPYASDIMNIILFITIFSGANSGVYAASRMIWSLAEKKTLPKKLSRLSKNGIPIYGLSLTILGGFLALFSSIYAPNTVYLALTAISAFAVVIVWLIIGWAQLNFRKQFIKNGHSTIELSYKAPFYPILPWLVIVICSLSLIGIAFDPNQRIAIIIGIPFSIICYVSYKIFYSRKDAE
ncbi:amino acid permease [Apilactobacillus micheneri]|uniref:Amino acid permease n=1 Tax=Apilactobacillus micheneri TaxID=1899430 RepID=A0ABY2YWB5_9LACO|nr:amino acid permease [Apilactobacillus micheneri]TPR24638.1 amino acid permease [Apilactobacillus micheneri]TPR25949.1 amino acid permease [Apilactobacillus micheneri]TPR28139.1 amino acid permease [Apilactobacillus micheneri]TPR29630.1 amino acid permease [Apilactobacillus micheneri]TPR30416.1 amino acid permease [Apilactobacillus micheneri]